MAALDDAGRNFTQSDGCPEAVCLSVRVCFSLWPLTAQRISSRRSTTRASVVTQAGLRAKDRRVYLCMHVYMYVYSIVPVKAQFGTVFFRAHIKLDWLGLPSLLEDIKV